MSCLLREGAFRLDNIWHINGRHGICNSYRLEAANPGAHSGHGHQGILTGRKGGRNNIGVL